MYLYLLLIGATVYPCVGLVSWVSSRDQLPEPEGVVWRTAIFGGLAVIPILVVQSILVAALDLPPDFEAVGTVGQAVLMSFIVAALAEESFKFLVLRGYSARHDAFDEPFDGIVYGVAAGMGFAVVENVLYVFQGWMGGGLTGGFVTAIMRAITAVPGHAASGVIMGACIGIGRFKPWRGWLVLGFLGAVGFHGAYDAFLFLLTVPSVQEAGMGAYCVAGFVMVFLLEVVVAGLAIARMRRDQTRRITDASMAEEVSGIEFPPVPEAIEASRGVPGLPMASLIVAGSSAALFVLAIAIGVVAAAPGRGVSEQWVSVLGLATLLAILLALVAVPLSIVALVRQPRWKAASILALVCGAGELLVLGGLVAVGLASDG